MEPQEYICFSIDGLPNQTSICQLVVTCLALLANEHTGFAFPRLQMGLIVWHLAHLGITDGTSFGTESLATDRWLLTGAVTRLPYVQFSFCFSRDSWEDTFYTWSQRRVCQEANGFP